VALVNFGSVILVGLALFASACGPSAPTTNVQATVATQVEATVAARTVASTASPIQVPPTATPSRPVSPTPVSYTPVPPTLVPPTPSPQPAGTRLNPAAFTEPFSFTNNDGRQLKVQVIEVNRDANSLFRDALFVNPKPDAGEAWIVAKLRMTYVKGPEDKAWKISPGMGDVKFYAGGQMWGAPGIFSLPPEPRFPTDKDIFPGATIEGWLDGRHIAQDLRADAVLVFEGHYFSLK
jgi:hypothetical protein